MKTKKTIRKMRSPLAREVARMARSAALLEKRLDLMAMKIEEQDTENRDLRREVNALHSGQMMPQSKAIESGVQIKNHLEELYPDDAQCDCGHPVTAHAPDHPKDKAKPCHVSGCSCMNYEKVALDMPEPPDHTDVATPTAPNPLPRATEHPVEPT
jgi:hypothetical protein